MQRITELFKGAFRWLPNQYNNYKLNNELNCVPVLRVTANINSDQTRLLKQQLDNIKSKKKAVAIALLVDSCEGSAAQAHIIIQRLKGQAAKRKVPLLTFGQDLCVATGFLLLTAGDKAYADKTSLIGTTSFGATKTNAKSQWLEKITYGSSGQSFLEPEINNFDKLSDDKRKQILEVSQEIQNEVQSQIKSYRGDRLKEANFELMSSDQALKAGLIDGIGTFQETIDKEYPGAKVYYVPDGSQSIKERLKRLRSRFGMLVQSTQ